MRIFLSILFALFFQLTNAQWHQTNGPFGGSIRQVVKSDTLLFAGTEYGIYRSSDGGEFWQEVNNGFNIENSPSAITHAMIAANSGVYASIWGYGTFKSIDNGDHWSGLTGGINGIYVTCFDTVGTDILAGSTADGIFISNDSGATWNTINNGLTNLKIKTLVHTDSLFFAGTENGIFRSDDYGNNWYPVNNGLADLYFYDLHIMGTKIIARSGANVYVSSDSGNVWTNTLSMTCSFSGGTFAQDGNILYCGSWSNCKMKFSLDTGLTWIDINNFSISDCYSLNVWDGVIYGCSANTGIHISTDHGNSWNVKNNGIIHNNGYEFLNNGSELWSGSSGGTFKTTDEGLNWDSIVYNGNNLRSGNYFKYGNYIFASESSGILRSPDNGNSWNLVYPTGGGPFMSNNGNLFGTIANVAGVIMSPDSGLTWINVSTGLNSVGVYSMVSDSTNLYVGTSDGVFRSTNNGSLWSQINSGLPANQYVPKLAINDNSVFCIANYKIFRSDNNGLYWNLKDFGCDIFQFFDILANGSELYAVGNGGVFVSLNNGDSWSPFNDSLVNYAKPGYSITLFNNNLYLGTNNAGVWKHPLLNSIISGRIYNDTNNNCINDPGEAGLARFGHSYWMARASKQNVDYYAVPDTNGYYSMKVDIGTYNVSLVNPALIYSVSCPPTQIYSASLTSNNDTVNNIDFALDPQIMCSRMRTSVSASLFRPCLTSIIYVDYCNEGTIAEPNAVLTLNLPTEFTVLNSSIPWNAVSGNSYTYNIGFVQPGACGSIIVTVDVLCDPAALLNATLCVRSEISPEELCSLDSTWDQSSVQVDGDCVGDSLVCFTITNNGNNMLGTSEWRLYADNIFIQLGTFQLQAGQDTTLCFAATGQTFRLEADQRPNHPGNSHPNLSIERCGDLGPFQTYSLGQILSTPLNSGLPYISDYCAIVRNSYDPNEKSVVPAGLGSHHIISKNDRLEYKIDFQNTGNDTAFAIVVKDSIDISVLDMSTIEIGTSSHNFNFSIESPNVLVWSFNNIYLADSNTNETLSHGFINFSISQLPNLASGTQIRNKADIYFDFNQPVATNSVINTICFNTPPLITYNGQLHTIHGLSYQWYLSGTPIPGATTQHFTPTSNGIYTVDITDVNGCFSQSDPFNLITLSVPSISNTNLSATLYPNPSYDNSILTIKPSASGRLLVTLIGTDSREHELLSEKRIEKNQLIELPIETNKLQAGVYIIRITLGEEMSYLRLLVIN